ncbi:hypothetical protein LTR94_028751, partial [Friedmanniomyces endolithicus]
MVFSPSRRQVVGGVALSLAASGSGWAADRMRWDAVVTRAPRHSSGAPVYDALSSAIKAAPLRGERPFRILVTQGIWDEQIVVDRPFIHLIGEARSASVIHHVAASGMAAPDGRTWGTFRTPTVFVRAPNFRAENLTIVNAFDGLAEMSRPGGLHSHDGGGPQAVALMMDKGSDHAHVKDCDILSYQDTLFPDAGASLFENCLVTGSYDFIFGAGRA